MILTCKHEDLRSYLLWASKHRLGMHCKTTTELAELLTSDRTQSSINFVGLAVAEVGRKLNLEFSPNRDANFDWFSQNWPFIAQQKGYRTYP